MTKKFLSTYEITQLINLNISTNWYRATYNYSRKKGIWENELYISSQKPEWNSLFFDPILKDNPTLEPLVAEFWEKAKTENCIESLAGQIFNGKITIDPISHMLFRNCANYINSTDRKNFVKKFIIQNPTLMNEIHNSLKKNYDAVLLAVYIELLPTKINLIKDSEKSILKILEYSNSLTESNQTKILSAICRSFEHNQELYEFIQNHFGENFEKMHSLREKFLQLESKYFSQFKKETKISIFDSNEIFTYSFNIKDSSLVDIFNVKKTLLNQLKLDIFNSLRIIINKNIDKNIYFDNTNGSFNVHTYNFEYKDKIHKLMFNIESVLPQILKVIGKEYKATTENANTIHDLLSSSILKFYLEDTLNTNQSKNTKLKI